MMIVLIGLNRSYMVLSDICAHAACKQISPWSHLWRLDRPEMRGIVHGQACLLECSLELRTKHTTKLINIWIWYDLNNTLEIQPHVGGTIQDYPARWWDSTGFFGWWTAPHRIEVDWFWDTRHLRVPWCVLGVSSGSRTTITFRLLFLGKAFN